MGIINAILMLWILAQLNAPMWCYVLIVISMAVRYILWSLD